MDETATHVVTRLLDAAGGGDAVAREKLLEAVYGELRQIAASQMAGEHPGRTLQPTALVHEAWLRLMGGDGRASPNRTGDSPALKGWFANRRHFFAAAANAMRRIRIDDARRRKRLKRGGEGGGPRGSGRPPSRPNSECASEQTSDSEVGRYEDVRPGRRTVPDDVAAFDADPADDLALDEALTGLEQERPDLAELVQLRYFAGLSIDQTAELLSVTPRTIDNRWQMAKAWLKRALE